MKEDKIPCQYPESIMPYGFGKETRTRRDNTRKLKAYLLKHGSITRTKARELVDCKNIPETMREIKIRHGLPTTVKKHLIQKDPKRFESTWTLFKGR